MIFIVDFFGEKEINFPLIRLKTGRRTTAAAATTEGLYWEAREAAIPHKK